MKITTLLLLAVFAVAAASGTPGDAVARDATIVGPDGRVVTRSVDRAPGSVDAVTTLPNGRLVTRGVTRTREGASGTVVGPRGRVITREVTR